MDMGWWVLFVLVGLTHWKVEQIEKRLGAMALQLYDISKRLGVDNDQ